MHKSLKDLFKVRPPTTYEIEAGEEAERTGVMTAEAEAYFAFHNNMNSLKRKKRPEQDSGDSLMLTKKFIPDNGSPNYEGRDPVTPDYEQQAFKAPSPSFFTRSPVYGNISPTTSNQSPLISNCSPSMSNQTPLKSNKSPLTSNHSPSISNQSPSVTYQSPSVSNQTSIQDYQSPSASRDLSDMSNHSPVYGNISPAVKTEFMTPPPFETQPQSSSLETQISFSGAASPIAIHNQIIFPPRPIPAMSTDTFVSPLDIILKSVQAENSRNSSASSSISSKVEQSRNSSVSSSISSGTQLSPADQLLQFAHSINGNDTQQKKKLGKKMRLRKQKKRSLTERDHAATLKHLDQPDNNANILDKDVDDLFSEFEQLKAKRQRTTHQQPTTMVTTPPVNTNQTRVEPVPYDALPDYHIPASMNHSQQQQKKQGQQKKNKKVQTPFVPRKPCFSFMKGYCKAGDKCTFKHEMPENVPPPPPSKQSIVVCQFYKTGACTQFDECKFSHDLKLEPCRFFHMSGSCEQGDQCVYSHEPLNQDRLQRLRLLTGPCRFYHFKGYCNNPDTCMFSHDDAPEEKLKQVESSIKPCRFFHIFNNCTKPDCFYAHEEATPAQIQELVLAEKKKPPFVINHRN